MPKEIRSSAPIHRTLPYPTVSSSTTMAPYTTASSSSITHQAVSPPPSAGDRHGDRQASASWPKEKDELLMQARQQGLNWAPIASTYFPDKSPNACRKRHERLMEKRSNLDDWDGAKMEALAKAYNDVREQMWKLLADRIGGEKWQVVESKCMEKGLKTLTTAGRTAIRRERLAHNTNFHSHTAGIGGTSDYEDYLDLDPLDPSRERSKSNPNSEIGDSFNDSAIGPDADHPFASGRSLDDGNNNPHSLKPSPQSTHQALHGHQSYPTPSRGHSPPFPPPARTFSNASSSVLSSTGFTPIITAAPPFPSQLQSSTQFPSQFQSRERQNSGGQTLPSFSAAFGMPSISSVTTHSRMPVTSMV